MNKIVSLLLFGAFSLTSINCAPFNTDHLPKIIAHFIHENENVCKRIKDNNHKAGIYKIGSGISRLNFLNHDMEYFVYLSSGTDCSSSASLDQGNGGPHLVIFANVKDKWQKIHDEHVLEYYFESPNVSQKTTPAPLIIRRKGIPGSTVEEVRYEWDIANNHYEAKSTKENIYRLNTKK